MSATDLKSTVTSALTEVAPEADPAALDPSRPLQDQLDLDSLDFLSFLEELAARTGVEVPEQAYAEVATLDGCVDYLAAHGA
jgi:acyl carrier protein